MMIIPFETLVAAARRDVHSFKRVYQNSFIMVVTQRLMAVGIALDEEQQSTVLSFPMVQSFIGQLFVELTDRARLLNLQTSIDCQERELLENTVTAAIEMLRTPSMQLMPSYPVKQLTMSDASMPCLQGAQGSHRLHVSAVTRELSSFPGGFAPTSCRVPQIKSPHLHQPHGFSHPSALQSAAERPAVISDIDSGNFSGVGLHLLNIQRADRPRHSAAMFRSRGGEAPVVRSSTRQPNCRCNGSDSCQCLERAAYIQQGVAVGYTQGVARQDIAHRQPVPGNVTTAIVIVDQPNIPVALVNLDAQQGYCDALCLSCRTSGPCRCCVPEIESTSQALPAPHSTACLPDVTFCGTQARGMATDMYDGVSRLFGQCFGFFRRCPDIVQNINAHIPECPPNPLPNCCDQATCNGCDDPCNGCGDPCGGGNCNCDCPGF